MPSKQQDLLDLCEVQSWYQSGALDGGIYLPGWAYQSQDSAGTAVTAAGQVVGLWRDATWGGALGPELVTNGGPFVDATGWSGAGATLSVADGNLIATSGDGTADRAEHSVSGLTVGALYLVSVVAKCSNAAAGVGKIASWTWGTIIAAQLTTSFAEYKFYVTATATSGVSRIYAAITSGSAGDTATIKSLSIKRVIGNHAAQDNSSHKPISSVTSQTNRNWLNADSTDVLPVVFPSALGSTCTIARATPTGVVFSENQNLSSATWNGLISPNQFNGAVVLLNRTPTAQEKAVISRVLGRYVPALGADAEANPAMDFDASWAKGTGWGIGSGVATKTAGTASSLSQDVATSGNLYFVSADIVRTAGTIGAADGTNQRGAFAETGGLMQTIVSSSATIGLRGDASFAGTADNVRVREVL